MRPFEHQTREGNIRYQPPGKYRWGGTRQGGQTQTAKFRRRLVKKAGFRETGGTLRAGAEKRRQAPPTGGVDGGGRTGRNRVLFSGCSDVDLIGEETP